MSRLIASWTAEISARVNGERLAHRAPAGEQIRTQRQRGASARCIAALAAQRGCGSKAGARASGITHVLKDLIAVVRGVGADPVNFGQDGIVLSLNCGALRIRNCTVG